MPPKLPRNLVVAALTLLFVGGATAQNKGAAPAPAATAPAPAAAAPAAVPAAPAGAQQGVVYPGQPVTLVPTLPNAVVAPSAANTPPPLNRTPGQQLPLVQPGAPGSSMGALPPLPPPGATGSAFVSSSRQAVDDLVPPDMASEVRELRRRMDAVLRANSDTVGTAAKPVSTTVTVTQAPGETPPALRLAPAMVSNVVFTDATGQPWPVEFATPGDPGQVDVLLPVAGTATLQVRPKVAYVYGVMSVTLKDNPIPISLVLTTAQRESDTRLDVRVTRRGPNAKAPIIDRPAGIESNPTLMSVLDGVPPGDAKLLKSSYTGVQAWMLDDKLYVRTPLAVLSPAYFASMTSADGMHVYVLPAVPSIYVSLDGAFRSVALGE